MTRPYIDRSKLTPREEEIARLAASALTNQQIAAQLTISPLTVRNTLRIVFRKLGIHQRGDLAARLDLAARGASESAPAATPLTGAKP